MKIQLWTHQFRDISGSPVWSYELARVLTQRGHDTTIVAQDVGGIMKEQADHNGIRVLDYAQRLQRPDVLQVTATGPAHAAVTRFPGTPAVSTVHSTLIYERPHVHPWIRAYVGVRPQIVELLRGEYGIDPRLTTVIYNGVDRSRFRPGGEKFEKPTILFAGTVDYLRAAATHITNHWAAKNNHNVIYVGRKMSGQMDDKPIHVRYCEGDRWDIENLLRQCHMTAGILLGRTTIEGWACGLPGLVHDIDNDGNVLFSEVHAPPHPQLMELFDIETMADQYERLYESIA